MHEKQKKLGSVGLKVIKYFIESVLDTFHFNIVSGRFRKYSHNIDEYEETHKNMIRMER